MLKRQKGCSIATKSVKAKLIRSLVRSQKEEEFALRAELPITNYRLP